jgi:hypothetical protein
MKSTVQNPRVPRVDGEWWVIAGNPNLGRYNKEGQQPLDFAIWKAADQTWQMVACCRRTGCGGKGRLFHRWQTDSLLSENWTPMGIFMEADPDLGETIGGLQAPNVLQHNGEYFMFYGDWVNIRMARSSDGKTFSRLLDTNGQGGLGAKDNMISARDPHGMVIGDKFFLYFAGIFPDGGKIMCRVSDNLRNWGDPVIANCGGSAGSGTSDAECPFVVYSEGDRLFYLFRTHTRKEGKGYETSVYCSRNPLDFGVDSDQFKIASLPFEAVRLIRHDGQSYIAALKPDLTGMMMAKLKWAPGES